MNATLADITHAVLELPPRQRMTLASYILELDAAEPEPALVEKAWDEEICRRVEAVKKGTAELIPAEEIWAEIDQMQGQ